MGKSKTQTTAQTIDPASQAYIDKMRAAAAGAAGVATGGGPFTTGPNQESIGDQAAAFMNPYMSNVVDATRGEFDFLRGGALRDSNAQATQQGAYGGSRAALQAGSRLGAIDRAQGSTIADLLRGGWDSAVTQGTAYSEHQRQLEEERLQEPLMRQREAMGFLSGGVGPVGTTTKTTTPGNLIGDVAGIGLTVAGAFGGMPNVRGLFGNHAGEPAGGPGPGVGIQAPNFIPKGYFSTQRRGGY